MGSDPVPMYSAVSTNCTMLFCIFVQIVSMKGVSYLTDDQNHKKAVVIELTTLERYTQDLEDLLDGIIAESRKNDEKVPLKKVINNLRKAGKLK